MHSGLFARGPVAAHRGRQAEATRLNLGTECGRQSSFCAMHLADGKDLMVEMASWESSEVGLRFSTSPLLPSEDH